MYGLIRPFKALEFKLVDVKSTFSLGKLETLTVYKAVFLSLQVSRFQVFIVPMQPLWKNSISVQ